MRHRISEIKTDQYYVVEYIESWQGEDPKIGVWQGYARGGREVSHVKMQGLNRMALH